MADMSKGLTVEVYRSTYTGQPDQASELVDSFTMTGEGLPEIFTPNEHRPELVLMKGNLPDTWKAVPRAIVDEGVWPIFGGHYVGTSDGRLSDIIGRPAMVPVHDRVER